MTDPLEDREKPTDESEPREEQAVDRPKDEAPAPEVPPSAPAAREAAPVPIRIGTTEEPSAGDPTEEAPREAQPKESGRRKREPRPEPPDLPKRIEAILFATDQPVSARRIADAIETTEGRVKEIIRDLRAHYDADDRAFTVEEIAGGFQILTRSDFGGVVKALFEVEREHKLSQAALETLAIVAYKQPVIRAEIEDIRGVQVQPLLKTLQDQGLIRIVGRAERLGRPMLYGTTHKFLMTFGLKSANDLPPVEELRKKQ